MKKGLRSRIRVLQCPKLDLGEVARADSDCLQRRYADGFDRAVRLVLEYMDRYAPLPELLSDYVQSLRKKQVADIHGDGRLVTIIFNAGLIVAAGRILQLVHDEHGDEIERARAIQHSEDNNNL